MNAGLESWDIRSIKLYVGEAVESTGEFCFDRCILVQSCRDVNVGLFMPEIAMPLLNRMMILYCWIRCYCDSNYNHIDDCQRWGLGVVMNVVISYIHPSWQELTKKWGRDKKVALANTNKQHRYPWHSSRVSLAGSFRNVCGIWHSQPWTTKV